MSNKNLPCVFPDPMCPPKENGEKWTEQELAQSEQLLEAYKVDLCKWIDEKCNYNGGITPEEKAEYERKLLAYNNALARYKELIEKYETYLINKSEYDKKLASYTKERNAIQAEITRITAENAERTKRNQAKQDKYTADKAQYDKDIVVYRQKKREYDEAVDPERRRRLENEALQQALDRVQRTTRMNMFSSGSSTGGGAYTSVTTNGNEFTIQWRMVNTGRVVGNGVLRGNVEYRFVRKEDRIEAYIVAFNLTSANYSFNPNDTWASAGATFTVYTPNSQIIWTKSYDPYQPFSENINRRVELNRQTPIQLTGSTEGRVGILWTRDVWIDEPTQGSVDINFTMDRLDVQVPHIPIPPKPEEPKEPPRPVLEPQLPVPSLPNNPPQEPPRVDKPDKPGEPPVPPTPRPLRPRPKRPCKKCNECEECENIGRGPDVCEDLKAIAQERFQRAGVHELRNKYLVNLPNVIRRSTYGLWCVTKNIINQLCHVGEEFECLREQTDHLRKEQMCIQNAQQASCERLAKIAKNNYDIGNNVRNRLIQKLRDDAQKKSIEIANNTVRMNMFPRGSQAGSGTYTRVSTSGTNFTIEWNMVGGAVIGNGSINGTVEREFRLNTTTGYVEAFLKAVTITSVRYEPTGAMTGASTATMAVFDGAGNQVYYKAYDPFRSFNESPNRRIEYNRTVPLQTTGSTGGSVHVLSTRDTWLYDPTYGQLEVNFTRDNLIPIDIPPVPEIPKVEIDCGSCEVKEFDC